MPELTLTLEAKSKKDYEDKKFFAALQGVDLEAESSNGGNEWEQMKARVFSNGMTSNSNDILSLQGTAAIQAGFGIGAGLEYEMIS